MTFAHKIHEILLTPTIAKFLRIGKDENVLSNQNSLIVLNPYKISLDIYPTFMIHVQESFITKTINKLHYRYTKLYYGNSSNLCKKNLQIEAIHTLLQSFFLQKTSMHKYDK